MSCKSIDLRMKVGLIRFDCIDKTLNDMVPQLIPREPVNIDGVKPGFNTIRSNIQTNETTVHVEIDPTSNAPIAVFDGKKKKTKDFSLQFNFSFDLECDIHIPTNQKTSSREESISIPISSTYIPSTTSSPNFPRLTPYSTLRRSSSRTNVQ